MQGSLRRRSPESWELTISGGWDPAQQKYIKKSYAIRVRTKAEAQAEQARILAELASGSFVDPKRVTIRAYLEDWLGHCRTKGLSERTVEGYEGIVERYLQPALGDIMLQKLSPARVERLYTELLVNGRRRGGGSGLSEQTVLHVHRVLRCALKRAVRLRLLAANPCDAVEAPRPRREEMHALDARETNRMLDLLSESEDDLLYMAVSLAVGTGMRRGEIVGLRWPDFDFSAGTASIRRAMRKTRQGLVLKEPKTRRSARTITLPDRVLRDLQSYKAKQAAHKLRMGSAYHDEGLVFARPDGRRMDPDVISQAFAKFRTAHGFDVRFHDLRHTHATLLLQDGEYVKVVSERLGHSTSVLTLDTYAHVLPGMDRAAAKRFDRMLDENKAG